MWIVVQYVRWKDLSLFQFILDLQSFGDLDSQRPSNYRFIYESNVLCHSIGKLIDVSYLCFFFVVFLFVISEHSMLNYETNSIYKLYYYLLYLHVAILMDCNSMHSILMSVNLLVHQSLVHTCHILTICHEIIANRN